MLIPNPYDILRANYAMAQRLVKKIPVTQRAVEVTDLVAAGLNLLSAGNLAKEGSGCEAYLLLRETQRLVNKRNDLSVHAALEYGFLIGLKPEDLSEEGINKRMFQALQSVQLPSELTTPMTAASSLESTLT